MLFVETRPGVLPPREPRLFHSLGKTGRLVLALFLLLLLSKSANRLSSLLPRFASLDPDQAFAWLWLHHLLLLALTLGAMLCWSRGSLKSWGFNLQHARLSLRWCGWFALFYTLAILLIGLLTIVLTHQLPAPGFPLSARNLVGRLSFYCCSGLTEEPLFRGLLMTLLLPAWSGRWRLGRLHMPGAGVWAAIFFMLAHVQIQLWPFRLSVFSWLDQLGCLVLGLLYGVLFYRTRSLLGTILAHGFSNGITHLLLYATLICPSNPEPFRAFLDSTGGSPLQTSPLEAGLCIIH